MSTTSCARCKNCPLFHIHRLLFPLYLLLLANILVQFRKELVHEIPIEHLLDLIHLLPALVKPYKTGMLVLVRPDRGVRFCKCIDDGFAMSGVVDDVVDCKLLSFLKLES